MNKPLRILLDITGLKWLYKRTKYFAYAASEKIAARLRRLQMSSEKLGPPKGLVDIEDYTRRCSLENVQVCPQVLDALPKQEFEPFDHQLQLCRSEKFVPTMVLPADVTVMPKGRVFGINGLVITEEDRVIRETLGSFRGRIDPHPIFRSIRLPRVTHFPGRLAVMGYNYAHGYYHWMLEILPRFEILRRSGIAYDGLYMSPLVTSFQREALELIGFDAKRALWSNTRTHVKADQLVVPSLPGAPGQIPRWVAGYLRDVFLPKQAFAQTERILISRRKAARRRILNDEQVLASLRPFGFREVILEDYTVREQAKLFASAEWVVATHGAALTNLVFCSPGTHVVELFAPSRYFNNFQVLSHLMDLQYHGLLTSQKKMGRSALKKQDFSIDVSSLSAYMTRCVKA